ncbi:NAD-dependent epimerase/dehydratase family protein [Microlunatus elymi]|uniref:NAD-dependent epimerase/dehydratase family protein n=2 Tax=Microlunatus elymi TaxID=2596828 RepID=A0A516Q6X7_9ACTN|nr:NAD-dependent epimerase/dehydratase family protein [Microlunatus elymi]
MGKHIIVGAGPVGTETARLLVEAGHQVVSVTRSGRGPAVEGVERIAADASDAEQLIKITAGADVIYNCANPPHYGNWEEVWPPLWASMLQAAETNGATFVTASSLYGYGPVSGRMFEGLPDLATEKNGRIRASMWAEAKALHDAGRIKAVEVRASDYVGAGVGDHGHLTRNVPAALKGKSAMVIGNPHLPHSWTDVLDVARTLVAVADREDSWGRVWIAPTNAPRSLRQGLADVLELAGKPMVRVRSYPKLIMKAGGWFSADLRQLEAMSYIFTRSYVVDSTEAETKLGLAPTPWDEVCRRTLTSASAG